MFITYEPRKDSTRQDCSGTTVSLLKKHDDQTYKVGGYNNEGVYLEWFANVCELRGELPQ